VYFGNKGRAFAAVYQVNLKLRAPCRSFLLWSPGAWWSVIRSRSCSLWRQSSWRPELSLSVAREFPRWTKPEAGFRRGLRGHAGRRHHRAGWAGGMACDRRCVPGELVLSRPQPWLSCPERPSARSSDRSSPCLPPAWSEFGRSSSIASRSAQRSAGAVDRSLGRL